MQKADEECNDPFEFNNGHYFELFDRVHVAENYLDMALGDHPVLAKHPELKALYIRASESLAELYQKIGNIEETWINEENQ